MMMWGLFRFLIQFLICIWIGSFLIGRGMVFQKAYVLSKQHYADDLHFYSTICTNSRIKANLGKHSLKCDEVQVNLQTEPWKVALLQLTDQIYLCGSISCSDVLKMYTSTLNNMILLTCLVVVMPLLFIKVFQVYCQKYQMRQYENHLNYQMTNGGQMILPTKELIHLKKNI